MSRLLKELDVVEGAPCLNVGIAPDTDSGLSVGDVDVRNGDLGEGAGYGERHNTYRATKIFGFELNLGLSTAAFDPSAEGI